MGKVYVLSNWEIQFDFWNPGITYNKIYVLSIGRFHLILVNLALHYPLVTIVLLFSLIFRRPGNGALSCCDVITGPPIL